MHIDVIGLGSPSGTDPARANYFYRVINTTKFLADKIANCVYEIFRQIDNVLTTKFYPKKKEIAVALIEEAHQVKGIS